MFLVELMNDACTRSKFSCLMQCAAKSTIASQNDCRGCIVSPWKALPIKHCAPKWDIGIVRLYPRAVRAPSFHSSLPATSTRTTCAVQPCTGPKSCKACTSMPSTTVPNSAQLASRGLALCRAPGVCVASAALRAASRGPLISEGVRCALTPSSSWQQLQCYCQICTTGTCVHGYSPSLIPEDCQSACAIMGYLRPEPAVQGCCLSGNVGADFRTVKSMHWKYRKPMRGGSVRSRQ